MDLKYPVVVDGPEYQKPSAALRHHRWQEIVVIASSRENTDPAIDPSIERFEHFELEIRERLRLDHSTQKHDVAGAELRRRQDATANTVARMCCAREREQSERAENEHLQLFLHCVSVSPSRPSTPGSRCRLANDPRCAARLDDMIARDDGRDGSSAMLRGLATSPY